MQEAISVEPQLIVEHTTPTMNEDEATHHLSTMINATDQPLSGDEIFEIIQEAKRTNKSLAFVAKQRLKDRAHIQTVVSPADSIPDIASRTKHKPR
jgi:hypothetical protein